MLVVELFGTLSLRAETGAVPLVAQQRRPLALLAVLALGGKQGLSRHRIESYLWPESEPDRAGHALNQAVYAIRQSLGDDVIVSTAQDLRLNQQLVGVDLWLFDEAISAKDWARAASIYKGTLLDGVHFGDSRELESLIDTNRTRLRQDYHKTLELLANASAAAGDRSQSVTWWRKLANSDPLSPHATKKLMLALAAARDRAGALTQARLYQQLVRQELGMEPDSQVEALALSLAATTAETRASAIVAKESNENEESALQSARLVEDPSAVSPRSDSTLNEKGGRRGKRTIWYGVVSLAVLRARLVSAVALFLVLALAYTVVAWSRASLRSDSGAPVVRYSISLPDGEELASAATYQELMSTPARDRLAISPDGKQLLYVGSADVNHRLWLRQRDQLHATSLNGTEAAINPFFSPDGSRIGFVATHPPRTIKTALLRGERPSTLTDSLVDLGGAAWGCGYIYFDGRLTGDGIARIPDTGGEAKPATVTDYASGEWWHAQPEPLPNCKSLLYVAWRGNDANEATIAVVDLTSGAHRNLLQGMSPRYAASGHLLYVRADGTLMGVPFDQDKLRLTGEPVALAEGLGIGRNVYDLAISSSGTLVYTAAQSRGAQAELVWVDRAGTATPIDSMWRGVFTSVAASPDGKALAVGVRDAANNHIWIKRLNRAPTKLTVAGDYHDRPAWTPDGRAVLFVSKGRQSWDLYRAPIDGGASAQLVLGKVEYLTDAEYSRDGKWLLYQNVYNLFAVHAHGDSAPTRLVEIPNASPGGRGSGQRTPRLSPNGRWLAYVSDEDAARNSTGHDEVYVRPFPNTGSAKWQVSTSGGAEPTWSRDGRKLYYRNVRGDVVEATVPPGATFTVGKQRVLFSTAEYLSNPGFRTYDVAPDGRFVMIRLSKPGPDELIVVENFFEELKAKVKPGPRARDQ